MSGVSVVPVVVEETRGSIRLFVRVCESLVPTIVPEGAVRDVPHADPVDTAIPALG
jgi:hypothetical protein